MKKLFLTLMSFAVISSVCFAQTVVFNTKTLKYHKSDCRWAKKCTVSCIRIEKEKAKSRGGKPCKVCGS